MAESLRTVIDWFRGLSPKTHKIVGAVILFVVLVLLYPFQSTVVPLWKLQVVDDQGANVSGIKVTQHWQHNSLEDVGHEELKVTDTQGNVVFNPRKIRASLLRRAYAPLVKHFREARGAKFGPYASVVVWGSKENETNVAVYEREETPPSRIVVRRVIRMY